MQYLELLLIILSTLYLVFNRFIHKNLPKPYLLAVLVFILSIHLIFEGIRWQMIPAYFLWLIALITALRPPLGKSTIIPRLLKATGLIIILGLAITLPILLPVFKLAPPTGPFTVGTTDIYLELDREETITADKTDTRRFMVKAWYPSKEIGQEKDFYVDQAGRNGFARKYGLSPFMLNYFDKIDTHVYRDISIANESFPILIFSHGYNSKANGYYALLSEIVSQGYIVFAINHTYESTGTTFSDGTLNYFDYAYAGQIESGTWEDVLPAIEAFESRLSFEERHPTVQKALTSYFVRGIVERWAEDIVDVVDQLATWNDSGFFKGKLDVSKVGVFGHSRGGGAAGEALLIDRRIRAGANLDGVQWGQIVDTVFQKPFLFLSADWPADHQDLNQHAYINKSTSFFYKGTILQSGHSNFMDIPFIVPLQALNQAGDIDPNLAIEIASKTVSSFFDKHLKHQEINMQALSAQYNMLEMHIHQGDSIP